MSKLPPRLAKQREQKEREKKENKAQASPVDTFIKIENWDNELANNIPAVTASLPEPPPPKTTSKSCLSQLICQLRVVPLKVMRGGGRVSLEHLYVIAGIQLLLDVWLT